MLEALSDGFESKTITAGNQRFGAASAEHSNRPSGTDPIGGPGSS
jgi:hypothetical protein